MSKSNLIFQMEYKKFSNKKLAIGKWMEYASKKENADCSSIDEYNLLKDYALFSDKENYLNENSETFLWTSNGDLLRNDAIVNLGHDKGFFWRGFISFPPDFAIEHGLITKADYFSLTNQIMPSLILDMGLDLNNTSWFCSLHRNTKHPHIHFCIFENMPKKENPLYPKFCITNCKSNIANYLIDYKKFYQLRDQSFSNIVEKIDIKDFNKIKGQRLFSDKYRREINVMLLNLYNKLPKKGRLQYNSQNMKLLKPDLDMIIEYILMHDSIRYDYANYLKLLEQHQQELNQIYGNSISNKNRKYYIEQKNRLYSKIGNEILLNFKRYQALDYMEREKQFLNKHIHEMKFRSNSRYVKEESRLGVAKDLYKICMLAGLNDSQTKKVFERWIRNSNYKYNPSVLILSLKMDNWDMSIEELYSSLKRLGYDPNRYNRLKSNYFYQELSYKTFVSQAFSHLSYELEQEEKQIISQLQYEIEGFN